MRVTLEKNEKSKKWKIPFWDNHIQATHSKFELSTSNSVPSRVSTDKQTHKYTHTHTYKKHTYRVKTEETFFTSRINFWLRPFLDLYECKRRFPITS